ncbi:MAG: hypothetical protein COV74_01610 [Candidatus Omnitrophica bacterium CG11_big_fil_rev_8_21_14_0_20_45_26]|uniref:Uncharacterized protein n=1 Tax=Candidatus Abzuiibacterium crystallinum TaxID=1974748 RepID=A0A2H0LU96_9BACT|nr:MAG: hypothetical protein COV74_01610 [Candidatus Omnitrophica bacterium CG11_big_fil_rev_8_21_14_0_20_45_26]PIW64993.1 MAG: hypothetical protein COW12_03890 [Candidatus Omnitrophica bacterium CG12_big_fil_rev_8_21_14_0_65_45_16]
MIKVNLLPIEFRQVEVKQSRVKPQTALLAIFFLLLAVALIQLFSYVTVQQKVHRFESEMEVLKAPSAKSDSLTTAIKSKLEPEIAFFRRHVLANVLVAEILNSASDLLPEGMWLSDIRLNRGGEAVVLEMTGYAKLTTKQIAVAQIQEYVNKLKAQLETMLNEGVSDNRMQEVKITLSTNLREVSSSEVMQFAVNFQSLRKSG